MLLILCAKLDLAAVTSAISVQDLAAIPCTGISSGPDNSLPD
jgi:hypothetical protein